MRLLVTFFIIILFCYYPLYLSCTNNDALFDPTGETGITVSAFVCDTTGLDTTITQFDSTLSTDSSLAGQTVTFIGLVKGDSANLKDLTWEWDFGDDSSSFSRIAEHRYTNESTYAAIFTVQNSAGLSLSDTVRINVSEIKLNAGVRGYAFLAGKVSHENISVVLKSKTSGFTYPLKTSSNGLFKKLEDIPAGVYEVFYKDSSTFEYPDSSLDTVIVNNGILTEIKTVILQDIYPVPWKKDIHQKTCTFSNIYFMKFRRCHD